MGILKNKSSFALPVIVDGKFYPEVLNDISVNEEWLEQQLKNNG